MIKNNAFTLLSGLLIATAAHHSVLAETEFRPRYNVLFIIADDLNTDLGCYGHPLVQTPNIDRLSEAGRQFEQAYCQISFCGPSRNSFMSGLYSPQTQTPELRDLLRDTIPNAVTMSQHFMANGYRAARVGKIYHYDNPGHVGLFGHDDPPSWNIRITPRGRDKDIEDSIIRVSYLRPEITNSDNMGGQLSWLADIPNSDELHTDGLVVNETIELLDSFKDSGEPFFLATGLFRPHTPFVAPTNYFALYDLDDIVIPTMPEGYFETLPDIARFYLTRAAQDNDLPEDLGKLAVQAYYASISFLDAQVGRLLDHLESIGLIENTIIVFTSDHGYHLGEKGHYMKQTLYDRGTKVPLILSAPGMSATGTATDAFAELIDLYPTLSDLANLPAPKYSQGVSLRPVVQDPNTTVRTNALSYHYKFKHWGYSDASGYSYSLRQGDWRFTRYADNAMELFNLATDPDEMTNLVNMAEHATQKAELETALDARIAEAEAPHPYPAASQRFPFGGQPHVLPGKIEAEYYDWGGENTTYHDTTPGNETVEDTAIEFRDHTFRLGEDPDTIRADDNGQTHSIAYIADGEWLEYTVDLPPGIYSITARIASSNATPGNLQLSLDGEAITTIPAIATGDGQSYTNATVQGVSIPNGGNGKILRLTFNTVPGTFNLNWIRFEREQTTYALWQNAHTWQSTDPLPDEDDDADGYPNWQEYISGSDPTDAASHPHIQKELDASGQRLALSVRRQSNASDATAQFLYSTNLIHWSTNNVALETLYEANGLRTETGSIEISTNTCGFLQYKTHPITQK